MDIDLIYSMVKFIANKNQSGYISPTEFNNAFNLAQTQYFHQLVEDIQGWDANRKRIRLPMGNAQQAIQKVEPFIVSASYAIPGNGYFAYPVDLANVLAIRVSGNAERVWRVEHDRLASHISSVIDPPIQSPIYVELAGAYQFYPSTISQINMDYLRQPPDALWAFTLSSNRPVYDQANSVQPLWRDTEITDIIIRVLFMFGISIQATQLVQYYGSVKSDGQ